MTIGTLRSDINTIPALAFSRGTYRVGTRCRLDDEGLIHRGRVYCGNMYILLGYYGCHYWRVGTCTYSEQCRAQTRKRLAMTNGRNCPLCAESLALRDFTVMHIRAQHPRAVWLALKDIPK